MSGREVDRWVSDRLQAYIEWVAEERGFETWHGAVSFVLRALVNPAVPGSGAVLDELVAARVRLEAETEA